MLKRKAYSIQMNFDVPDGEKRTAEKAEECFDELLAKMKLAIEYLDLIYEPFKKYDNLDIGLIIKYRRTFLQYRDQVKSKYDSIAKSAFQCVMLMNEFKTDTEIEEMINSFMSIIRELEKYVDIFLSVFSKLNDPELKAHIVYSIDSIKKASNQIRQIVNDRIIEHIDTNILAKNWASDFSDKNQQKIEDKIPLVMQLFRERQEALKEQ